MWGQYRKIVSKYPAFKDFKPFRTNNWVYIQKLQENTPPLEQKRGISMNFFFYRPSNCLKSAKIVELEGESGSRKPIFSNRPHNKKRLTDGSNYVILYPQNSNISYLMLYPTSATNHEEREESCAHNTMSLIEYWGRQMASL